MELSVDCFWDLRPHRCEGIGRSPYGCPLDSIDAKRELGVLIQLFFMSTFPFFRLAHTDTYNDSDMGSLLLHSPWEALHEPTIITPPICWQFDHQQLPTTDNVVLDEHTRSQFGFMHEKYYHHQSPWILPVKSSELQPNGEEYSGPITKKAFHNARERHRRNKLKVLYSQLRSLLPDLNPKVNPKPTFFPYCSIILVLMH